MDTKVKSGYAKQHEKYGALIEMTRKITKNERKSLKKHEKARKTAKKRPKWAKMSGNHAFSGNIGPFLKDSW